MADTFKGIITVDGKKRQLPYGAVLEPPISDETLSIQGGFADAKVVGDKFKKGKVETDSLKEELGDLENVTVNAFEVSESNDINDYFASYSGKYYNSNGALAEYSNYTANVIKVDDNCHLTITSKNGALNSIIRVLLFSEQPPSITGVNPTTKPQILINQTTQFELDAIKGTYVAIDYVTPNGLLVTSVKKKKVIERKSDEDIRIKYMSTGFLILYPSKSGDYIGYQYGRYKVDSVHVDVWRLKTVAVYDSNLIQKYLLCANSYDCEGVLRINGQSDYIGSVHGDEIGNSVKMIIDGKEYSTTDNIDIWCKSIVFAVNSNVYEMDSDTLAFTKDKLTIFDRNGVTVTNKWKAINQYTLVHVRSCLVSINKYADDVKLVDRIYDTHKQLIPMAVPPVSGTASILYSDNKITDAYVVGDIASVELHAIERGGNQNNGMVNDMGSRIKPYIDCYVGETVQSGDVIYCKSNFKYSCN